MTEIQRLAKNARRRARRAARGEDHLRVNLAWRNRNRAKVREVQRRYELKQYGLTLEDERGMFRRQGGLCAICRARPAKAVDHDHATGRVRGLLCGPCNRGLGLFHDQKEVLRRALEYLG